MAIGLAAAGLAALLANLGLIAQKVALDRRAPGTRVVRAFLTPTWLGGLAMTQCGWAAQLIALRNAPLYVVQPIIASGLLVLAAAARVRLKEAVGIREWGAVLAIASGATVLSLVALSDSQQGGAGGSSGTTVLFAAGTAVVACLIAFAARRFGKMHAAGLAISAGLLYALTVVLSKPIASMLNGSPAEIATAILSSYEIYAVAILSIGALLVNQHALSAGRAITVVPIVVVAMAVIPVGAGLAIFNERLPAGAGRFLAVAAVIACIGGAGLLATVPSVAGFAGDDDEPSSNTDIA
ncbi:MAG: hypothetical protein DCC49_13270 [Acidobacteria bacterium]|nr:MAG: hypothetical protein DCC49_13270 [Acidobacteriota bacterium]